VGNSHCRRKPNSNAHAVWLVAFDLCDADIQFNAAISRGVCGGGLCAKMGAERACTQIDTAYTVGCMALLDLRISLLP